MPKQIKMKYTKMIIFTNPDHSGSKFDVLKERGCTPRSRRPYIVFELKKFDTFWCRKDGSAGARAEYMYKWREGHFVVLDNWKEYAPFNIKYFSTREEVEEYFKSLPSSEKSRFYTYYPYDNVGYQKGYSDIV